MSEQYLRDLLSDFDIRSDISNAKIYPYGGGHINSTFLIEGNSKYILQKINTNVFKNPVELMNNIVLVTSHIKKKIEEAGEDPEKKMTSVVKAKNGDNMITDKNGDCYRVITFVNAISHETIEHSSQLYRAAKTYGQFQKMLADFPAEKLYEVIPLFHHTPNRFKNLEKAISENESGRLDSVRDDIEFALSYRDRIGEVVNGISDGSIPLRVTHNDTKINNFLFDRETDECICMIDFDTVMSGSLLYDFGDALRIGASSAAEDEVDLDKVHFCVEPFEQFTRGLLEELSGEITPRELELLPYSALLMTYEVGIRFLTDYLNGDIYFKTSYPEHNIVRARNQFKLVRDIDARMNDLNALVKKIHNELR